MSADAGITVEEAPYNAFPFDRAKCAALYTRASSETSLLTIERSAVASNPEKTPCAKLNACHEAHQKNPVASGMPGALYRPTAPVFRKGLRGQEKLCLFQPLRNGGTVGKYNVAGLPEILGVLQPRTLENKVSGQAGAIVGAAGAFALSVQGGGGNTASLVASGDSFTADSITLRASLSSSVYAASSTVMPASVDFVAGLYLGRTS